MEKLSFPITCDSSKRLVGATISRFTILRMMGKMRVYYPHIHLPKDEDGIKGYVEIWMEDCGHLTDAQFDAALRHHVHGEDGKWPITPPAILQAHRELKAMEPRPIMPPRSW